MAIIYDIIFIPSSKKDGYIKIKRYATLMQIEVRLATVA